MDSTTRKEELFSKQPVEDWVHDLFSPERTIRHRALLALEAAGPEAAGAVPLLAASLEGDESPVLVSLLTVVKAIGVASAPCSGAIARWAASAVQPDVRRAAIGALAALPPACYRDVPGLCEGLAGFLTASRHVRLDRGGMCPDTKSRADAVTALAAFGERALAPFLDTLADPQLARIVIQLVRKMDLVFARKLEFYERALEAPEAQAVTAAGEAMAEMGRKARAAVPGILRTLRRRTVQDVVEDDGRCWVPALPMHLSLLASLAEIGLEGPAHVREAVPALRKIATRVCSELVKTGGMLHGLASSLGTLGLPALPAILDCLTVCGHSDFVRRLRLALDEVLPEVEIACASSQAPAPGSTQRLLPLLLEALLEVNPGFLARAALASLAVARKIVFEYLDERAEGPTGHLIALLALSRLALAWPDALERLEAAKSTNDPKRSESVKLAIASYQRAVRGIGL